MSLTAALLTQAATTGAGVLADEVLNEDPDIPDFSAEARAEFDRRRQELNDILGQRRGDVEAGLSASGRTGSAGASSRREVFGKTAESFADLASKEAQAVQRAENRERRLRFRREQATSDSRSQAISDLVGVAGSALAAKQLGDGGGGGGEGGGGGSTSEGSSDASSGGITASEYLSSKYGFNTSTIKGGD